MSHTGKTNDTIQLEHCNRDGKNCEDIRSGINKNLKAARELLEDKQYEKAFNLLLLSYRDTYDLETNPCKGCAGIFRSVIYSSVESISLDLKNMTSGLFKKRQLIPYRDMAFHILGEMEKLQQTPNE